MNSFDIVFSELKKSGMGVDIKRKRDDGTMVDAREHELASLGTKSTVASTAGLLKKLPPNERLDWAIETKNEANAFYKERKFREAMGKYVECLAATDFGAKDSEKHVGGNVDVLVIPVLCNLAACCIQVEEWSKAVSFSDQALILRPECCKAQLRKGLGLLRIGEFELALDCFEIVQNTAVVKQEDTDCDKKEAEDEGLIEDPSISLKILSRADWTRLPALILQAKRGRKQHREQWKRQKESLAKAFAKNSTAGATAVENDEHSSDEMTKDAKDVSRTKKDNKEAVVDKVEPMNFLELLVFMLKSILDFFVGLLKRKKA